MTDDLSDLLAHDAVLESLAVPNKKALFQQLGNVAARQLGLDARMVSERLSERERLGSTGFGGGIAIPHGKIDGLTKVTGWFARLSQPIEFAAVDDMPVDLVFLLLSPTDAGVEHLKALARVSRRLRDRGFVAKLHGAGSQDALWALFANNARDAA
ncbi:PTS sugar transporter subunit IIA [Sphingomonas jatrophae]|uniref:PTS IIA-like nitrogen-regulatory protein PtsN n=1 Tax=Sphingomonas jatrophae TaxID=1166337 RepID=A0A1I6LNT4_9SPHN|nr:PTS sugar transporter subunit IIA [Sphingomonas jatrophae]SFS05083.1 PTS IIA-like nitrogen-regulatory protein PtsN [Sphingomonas jatrophae]